MVSSRCLELSGDRIKNSRQRERRGIKCEQIPILRSSHSEVFLGKGVLKICSIFRGEHPCRSVIPIKMQSNLIEITLRHGCSPVNLLHIFRTPFPRNTSWWLLLNIFKTRRFIEKCPKNNYRNKKQSMTMFRSSFMMRSSFSLTKQSSKNFH